MPVGNTAMITRCPDCNTAFRVTEEQLALREGMVRCGHCGMVFDAGANTLVDAAESASWAAPDDIERDRAETPPADRADPAEQYPHSRSDEDGADGRNAESAASSDVASDCGAPRTADTGATSPTDVVQAGSATALVDDFAAGTADAHPAIAEGAFEHSDELTFASRHAEDAGAAPDPAPTAGASPPAHDLSVAPHEPAHANTLAFQQTATTDRPEFSFGRKKRPARARISPWLAWPAASMLLFVLVAQAAFYFRGDLTLLFPTLKPYAQEACAELGCQVPLPRRAELMSIENSDLQADSTNPGVMVLSAILRNRAPFAQTPPALELTLTDTQDQPVARRVLTATDYIARGAAGNVADSLFPAGSEVPVKVFFDASAVKASGYRLYLFYP